MPKSSSAWSEPRDGTSVGPTYHLEVRGQSFTVTALWSDTEGVGVCLDVSPDAFWTLDDLRQISAAITKLASIDPPQLSGVNCGR